MDMKYPFFILISLLTTHFSLTTSAQAPQGIPYQAIARNASGVAIANTAVKVRFSIRDSIATGVIKYQETHNPTTSTLGLFSVNVGMGTVVSGTFSGINWGKNAKFLQVELNTTGGTTYTDLGTTQMMSVPYALYAGQAATSAGVTTVGNGFTMISNQYPTVYQNAIYGFFESFNYCFNLVESGYSDWRLPSLEEYISYSTLNGFIDPSSNNTRFYGWTTTPGGPTYSGGSGWWFIGGNGPIVYSVGSNGGYYIKCVR